MWGPSKKAKYGVAVHNFNGKQVANGLTITVGDTLQIFEECKDWFRGCHTQRKPVKGIFPSSYIQLKPCQVDVEGPHATVSPLEDPVVREVTFVLREWAIIWKRLYVERKAVMFTTIYNLMLDMIEARKKLMSTTLTNEQVDEVKIQITAKIDWGNKKLGLDLVPRINQEPVENEDISPVELFRLHEKSVKTTSEATTRGSIRSARMKKVCPNHHVFMAYKSFGCNVGEETELHFQLYDAKTGGFFTEKFLMKMTKNGFPLDFQRPDQYYALFTDLGSQDLLRDAYLVVHAYRIGSLKDENSKKTSASVYRRPYGCAVTSIKNMLMGNLEQEREQEFQMKVYSESDFPQLHENILKKQSAKFNASANMSNYGVVVGLKMLHGELEDVKKEDPILFKSLTITRKMGFPDVIMPDSPSTENETLGDVRNDLYFTLNRGEFDRGSKSVGRNVEVKVKAYNGAGDLILECISPGAGERAISRYTSVIFYHSNTPRWNDTVKLDIPIEIFQHHDAHIRLEYRHISTRDKTEKKLFGFSFIRLVTPAGTTVRDGSHELIVWKCDDAKKLESCKNYLRLPYDTASVGTLGSTPFRCSEKEVVHVDTLLCSTKLTQNADLLSVLQWRSGVHDLENILRTFMLLDGQEVVKYLQDILDALFSMFEMDNGKLIPQAHLVFQALFHIFNLVEDKKFEHFKPVIDTYLSYHFSAVLVYRYMLQCLKETLDVLLSSSAKDQQYFHNCFRVLDFIIKFIVQARILFARTIETSGDDEFTDLCDQMLDSLHKILSINFDLISTAQSILLANTPKMYVELAKVYPRGALVQSFCKVMMNMSMEHSDKVKRKKLRCVREVVNSTLLDTPDCKKAIISMCCMQLLQFIGQHEYVKLCSEVLGDILKILFEDHRKKEVPGCTANIQTLLGGLLDLIVSMLLEEDNTVTIQNHLVSCLVTLLRLMDATQYRALLQEYREKAQLRDFLLRLLTLFQRLVLVDVFPADWMVMRMNMNQAMLLTLQFLSETLIGKFLSGIDFDYELWKKYFTLAVCFLTQPCLQLEKFSEVKRQKLRERHGDMRVQMGYEILAMWENLDAHKLHFVPGMVGPFLEVTLIPETELRKATLPIFYDMMECERMHRGNFKQVERELIDKLDILISENKGDEEYKELFNTILLQKVQSEPSWSENADGSNFVQSVTRLLERLLDYRKVLEGEENREKRMTCTVNLLNFYKNEINREEMYIRYIHKLCDLQLSSKNHTEAAFTMLLHAELLDWGDEDLPPERNFPCQPQWQRKEHLYRQIIAYFDIGKSWEYGIPLCEELAVLYKRKVLYKKLSDILQLEATFYEKILEELRPNPEYFRVGFYGQKFPLFLRNKEFIYRGNDYERLGSFQHRILSEFSGAALLNSTASLTESLRGEDSQYIMISPVKPVPNVEPHILQAGVPDTVQNFYMCNEVDTFQLDRPFHRGEKDDKNEFKTLCIERTLLHTSFKLPGILRWFEVIDSNTITLSPIETAIDAMEKKNKEIQLLTAQFVVEKVHNIKTLTMVLNGTIDAAVQGGIKKYQEAFFTYDFVASHPELVSRLKTLFLDQVQLLTSALKIHGRLVPTVAPDVLPLHNRLMELFKAMRQGIKETGSPNLSRLISVTEALTHMTSVASQRQSGSSTSSKSISPSGSNRSSDVLSDTVDSISLDSISSTNTSHTEHSNAVIGFGSLGIQATLNTSLTCIQAISSCHGNKPLRYPLPPPHAPHQQDDNRRPRSAVFHHYLHNGHSSSHCDINQSKECSKNRSHSVFYVRSPTSSSCTTQSHVGRPPSEPLLNKAPSMTTAPSSISLDSGTPKPSSRVPGSRPPPPPPRLGSALNQSGPALPPRQTSKPGPLPRARKTSERSSPVGTPTHKDSPQAFQVKVASPIVPPNSSSRLSLSPSLSSRSPVGGPPPPLTASTLTMQNRSTLHSDQFVSNDDTSDSGRSSAASSHDGSITAPPIPVKKRSQSSSTPPAPEKLVRSSLAHSNSVDNSGAPPIPVRGQPLPARHSVAVRLKDPSPPV